MASGLVQEIGRKLGYDIRKFDQQAVVESHLRYLFSLLEIGIVLDVGANEGQYAAGLRKIVGYEGEIHSFEPLPAAFEKLSRHAAADDKWHVYNYALGHEDGEAELKIAADTVFSSLHGTHAQARAKFKEGLAVTGRVEVPLRRLDRLVGEFGIDVAGQPTFLKMDTQGHDAWVFEGATGIVGQLKGLQAEVSVVGLYAGVPTYTDLLALYRDAGFELTGAYAIHRYEDTGHLAELDCVFSRT